MTEKREQKQEAAKGVQIEKIMVVRKGWWEGRKKNRQEEISQEEFSCEQREVYGEMEANYKAWGIYFFFSYTPQSVLLIPARLGSVLGNVGPPWQVR